MEQEQNTSLFRLGIDQDAKAHLWDAARWAKFLAICGFVMLGLMVIYGILMSIIFSSNMGVFDEYPRSYRRGGLSQAMGAVVIIFYIVIAVIAFFPYLFLYRFANKMKSALTSDDQATLNESFMNLKVLYRYTGILTIIGLGFMFLAILSLAFTSMLMG